MFHFRLIRADYSVDFWRSGSRFGFRHYADFIARAVNIDNI
jgi:hypothetical protein